MTARMLQEHYAEMMSCRSSVTVRGCNALKDVRGIVSERGPIKKGKAIFEIATAIPSGERC